MKGKRVTRNDVARLAGVDGSVVSNVINGKDVVAPATRERVLACIEELGYRPNLLARGLRSSRSHTLGLIVHDMGNAFYGAVAAGLEDAAVGKGYAVLFATARHGAEAAAHALLARDVDAVVVASGPLECNVFAAAGVPAVWVGGQSQVPPEAAAAVVPDLRGGARLAAEHVVSLGHRHVGLAAGDLERLAGWRAGLGEVEGCVVNALNVGTSYADGARAAATLLDRGVTAILTANDVMAMAVLEVARERGVDVPAQLTVVGYDDTWIARHAHTPLTTVRVHPEELGRQAGLLALELAAGGQGRRVMAAVELVIRESSGPAACGLSGPRPLARLVTQGH